MKKRGFEIVTDYAKKSITLPERKTQKSAGYDIAAAEDAVLLPGKVTLVPTGLKAYMQEDEFLGLHMRSSVSIKNALSFINSVGIIDADYYNNESNEGHIMLAIYNHSDKAFHVTKGMRLAQGIFYKYLLADDDDVAAKSVRQGGIGSTGV